MQIIVDDHTEMKYYKQCLEQINSKYSQDAEINKCTIIDICDICIETLVQDFTTILDRYRNQQEADEMRRRLDSLGHEAKAVSAIVNDRDIYKAAIHKILSQMR